MRGEQWRRGGEQVARGEGRLMYAGPDLAIRLLWANIILPPFMFNC